MKFPDFIIIGAPKCGTTALWYNLDKHPDISMATRTSHSIEMHFWGFKYWKNGLVWYKKLFEDGKLCGEKSVSYWSSNKSLKFMKKFIPDVKLILCVRNPVDRAYSNFKMHNRLNNAKFTFSSFRRYASQGKYIQNIENKILKYFNRDQLYVCVQEIMKNETTKEMGKIFNFLGVNDLNYQAKIINPFLLKNKTRQEDININRSEKFYRVWKHNFQMTDFLLRKQIMSYYNNSNRKLFDFLGFEIKEWK